MQTASAKAKGREGQKEVVSKILATFFTTLTERDVYSRPMGSQGEDLMMSPEAFKCVYFDDWEIKRRSRIGICRWIEQVIKRKSTKPIVCFREDRKQDWYCLIKLDDLLELLRKRTEYEMGRN
jgi:hypothetical protein